MSARARPWWRRALRVAGLIILGLVAFVVVAAGITLVWINTDSGQDWLRRTALAQARPRLPPGAELDIGRLDGFLPFNVTVEDVRVKAPTYGVDATIGRVHVNPELLPLLSKEIRLAKVHIDRPSAQIDLDVERPETEKKPFEWHVSIRDLRVRDGQVAAERQGRIAEVHDFDLRSRLEYEDGRIDAVVPGLDLGYRAGEARGELHAEAQARVTRERVDAALWAGVTGLMGTADQRTLIVATAEGPRSEVQARLRVGPDGAPLVQAKGSADLETPAYHFTAEVTGFDPGRLPARLPRGAVDLTFSVAGYGAPLREDSQAVATVRSSRIELAGQPPIRELELRARTHGRTWELEALRVAGPGLSLSSEGEGELLDRFRVALRASLDASAQAPVRLGARRLSGQARVAFAAQRGGDGVVRFDGSADVPALALGETRVRGFRAGLDGDVDPGRAVGAIELRTASGFEVGEVRVDTLRADARADGRVVRVEAALEPAPARGRAFGPATASADIPLRRTGGGVTVARHAPLRAELRWTDVPVAGLARLLGQDGAQLEGRLSVRARAGGTLAAPDAQAQVVVVDGRYADLRGVALRADLDVGPRRIEAVWTAAARGDALLRGRASIGAGPERLGDRTALLRAPLEVVAEVPAVEARRLAPLVPRLAEVSGRLEATVRVEGTLARPRLRVDAGATARREGGGPPVRAAARFTGGVERGRTVLDGGVSVDGRRVVSVEVSTPVTPADLVQGRGPRQVRAAARGEVGPFPIALLGGFYQPAARWSGDLSGNFDARASAGGGVAAAQALASLRVERLAVEGEVLGNAQLTARLAQQAAGVELALEQAGRFTRARARVDRAGLLQADATADQLDVGPLRRAGLVPQLAGDVVLGAVVVEGQLGQGPPTASVLQRLQAPAPIRVRARVDSARAALTIGGGKEAEEPEPPTDLRTVDERLQAQVPFELERLEIADSRISLIDPSIAGRPAIELQDVAATVENVANRREFMGGAPGVLTFRAVIERTGEVVGFAVFDPLAEQPLAAGRVAVRGLRLADLHEFLEPEVGLETPRGTLYSYAAFRLAGNRIDGSIKPVVTNLELEPDEQSSWLRAVGIEALDLMGDLAKDDIKGRDAVATVIPIKGTIDKPDVQIVPTILGVMRNAFVVGLASSFTNVPLQTAGERESIFTQAAQALSSRGELEAQPAQGRER